MSQYTSMDQITNLQPNEIFVFGSNLAGRHGAGAARQAFEQFGAQMGVGEGLTGQCYAFPSLGKRLEKLTIFDLTRSRAKLFDVCMANPDKRFLLTKVGCGLAGYDEADMRALFRAVGMQTPFVRPENLILPEDWK